MSALVLLVGSAAVAAARHQGPFAWVTTTSAPAHWAHLTTPNGRAVLSYPPSFRPAHSDPGAVTAAVGPGPRYAAYLNVTPRQGTEALRGFAALRVSLIGHDHDTSVREDGSAEGLHLRGGRASAVSDDYVTRVGHNHYREIAVFVVGRHGAWVVVGAALESDFARFRPLLERAIRSFAFS